MLTVRFPNGQAVTYNAATTYKRVGDEYRLMTSVENGHWVATIPMSTGCIIEASKPCLIENPLEGKTTEAAVQLLFRNMRTISFHHARELKRALAKFNAKRGDWKE